MRYTAHTHTHMYGIRVRITYTHARTERRRRQPAVNPDAEGAAGGGCAPHGLTARGAAAWMGRAARPGTTRRPRVPMARDGANGLGALASLAARGGLAALGGLAAACSAAGSFAAPARVPSLDTKRGAAIDGLSGSHPGSRARGCARR